MDCLWVSDDGIEKKFEQKERKNKTGKFHEVVSAHHADISINGLTINFFFLCNKNDFPNEMVKTINL